MSNAGTNRGSSFWALQGPGWALVVYLMYAQANPTTITGQGHGVLVAISAMCVFIAMLGLFSRNRAHISWRTYARYTLVTALVSFGLALASIALLNTDYTGLAERLGLTSIFLWFVVSGFKLWRSTTEESGAYAY